MKTSKTDKTWAEKLSWIFYGQHPPTDIEQLADNAFFLGRSLQQNGEAKPDEVRNLAELIRYTAAREEMKVPSAAACEEKARAEISRMIAGCEREFVRLLFGALLNGRTESFEALIEAIRKQRMARNTIKPARARSRRKLLHILALGASPKELSSSTEFRKLIERICNGWTTDWDSLPEVIQKEIDCLRYSPDTALCEAIRSIWPILKKSRRGHPKQLANR